MVISMADKREKRLVLCGIGLVVVMLAGCLVVGQASAQSALSEADGVFVDPALDPVLDPESIEAHSLTAWFIDNRFRRDIVGYLGSKFAQDPVVRVRLIYGSEVDLRYHLVNMGAREDLFEGLKQGAAEWRELYSPYFP